MGGCTNGKQFAEQLAEEGVQLGWETRLVPFGTGCVGADLRPGLCQPRRAVLRRRQARRLRRQPEIQQEPHLRLRAGPGRSHARQIRRGGGRHQLRLPGHRRHGHPADPADRRLHLRARGLATCRYETMVEKALEVRGCKVKITKVPIPVPYGPAFEGERIRKAGCACRVRRQQDHGLRVRHHGRPGRDQRRRDRGHRPGHRRGRAGRRAAAGHLGRGGGPQDADRTSSPSWSGRSTT